MHGSTAGCYKCDCNIINSGYCPAGDHWVPSCCTYGHCQQASGGAPASNNGCYSQTTHSCDCTISQTQCTSPSQWVAAAQRAAAKLPPRSSEGGGCTVSSHHS
eukprot:3929257-Prymnesium_polylepis.1